MELTLDQALQQGIAAHKEGKLQDAERLYRAILQAQPNHPDANHNLGVLAVAVGKPLEAIPLFKLALEANPQIEQFRISYVDALIKVERFNEAKRVLVEGERCGVPLEKLGAIKQRLEGGSSGAEPPQDQLNNLLKHYQTGKLEEVEELAKLLTQQFPKHPFAWKLLGAVLKQAGRANESLLPMQKSVELSPKDAEAHYNLGNTLSELGRLGEAEAGYRQAVALKPDYANAHNNLGATLQELGRPDKAEASYKQAIALKPDSAEVHSNLGNTLTELGKLDEAEVSLRQAIALKSDYAEAHYNLGNTLSGLGRLDEAEASYRRTIALKPDHAEAHNNLGVTLKELGRLDEVEASHFQAIALKPSFAEAHLNLCEFLEKTNAIDKLLDVLKEARSKTSNMEADFRYYETLAAFRKERYAEAATLVTQIIEDDVGENRRSSYYKLKGDICDREQDYDTAFAAYERSNQAVKAGLEYQKFRIAADHYFASQENTARQLEQLSIESSVSKRSSHDARQVTFLVGFPRSGTTLLDTILRTHSSIAVVEEQPMVRTMREALEGVEDIRLIETVDHERLSFAKNAYLDELSKHAVWPNESLVIDKFPLNLLAAPLIHQAFPEAKFILALRHPLDCILSCWMQTFKLNTAMANMVDLDRIVDFYCVAMHIFHLSQKRYGLDVHRIRYEDLTEEFEAETTSILRFLGLEWESELVNYQATALARRKISTPSHSQVIKPIYKTASYRWKHYEHHLEKYKSKLAPWFEEFGY